MAASAASSMMPPARILDLDVEVLTDSRQLEFSWTAPGEDFDQGERASKKRTTGMPTSGQGCQEYSCRVSAKISHYGSLTDKGDGGR